MIYAEIKEAVAAELAVSVSDSRVYKAVNEAQSRLITGGKWKGCYQKYRFCVNDGCITLPREVDGIEAFAVESCPGTVRNQWFEFLESGPGIVASDQNIGRQLLDQGLACAFDDVRGTGKQLAVYNDLAESASAKIVLRFYNNQGQFVLSQQGSSIQEGEALALGTTAGTYVYTTNECAPGGLVSVVKPITNGYIRLYERDTTSGDLRPLGYYAPTETVPRYRRCLIPDLQNLGCGECENVTVDVMAKLAHVPITGKDNDLLIIRSFGALKLAAKAIKHEASNDFQGAAIWWGAAQNELERELRSHLGDGAVQPIRTLPPDVYGAAVQNLI